MNLLKRFEKIVIKTQTQYLPVDPRRFNECVCLVTGGSGSIGKAISRRLGIEGGIVIVSGRYGEKLAEVTEALCAAGIRADSVVMDITQAESVETAMARLHEKYGRVDVLVNNAGYSARKGKQMLHEQDLQSIDDLLSANLRGSILTSRAVVPLMEKSSRGRIVHIASVVGVQGKARHAEYAAAKAGLFGLTKSQAIELGQYGITVNCVSPGLVPREDASGEKLYDFSRTNLLGRVGVPEDIAGAVAFLASGEAGFITGQNLIVDGGRSLGLRGDF